MATDYNSKYSGEQVEALLDQVASGNAGGGGGGGITVETDPIFSASPAAMITEEKIAEWDGKQDAISDLATIRSGANKGATAVQPKDVLDIVNEEGFVTAEDLAAVATSGSYNDLVDNPTFKTINGESILGEGNITISGGSGEKGDKGDTGVGIQSVTQTTTSNADGGSNVWSMVLTDGTRSAFTVKNGSKGSQGIQGIQGEQGPKGDKGDTGANGTNGTNGKDGADGATFTPSVDSAGNLSWSNDKGLVNPPTVNIKGPKGDKGDAGEGGGGTSGGGGVETISLSGGMGEPLIIEEMLAEKRYYLYVDGTTGTETIEIQSFGGHEAEGGITIKHFYAVIESESVFEERFDLSLILPDVDIRWANGVFPLIVGGDNRLYELSITQVNDYGLVHYNAVLTPFNSVG